MSRFSVYIKATIVWLNKNKKPKLKLLKIKEMAKGKKIQEKYHPFSSLPLNMQLKLVDILTEIKIRHSKKKMFPEIHPFPG